MDIGKVKTNITKALPTIKDGAKKLAGKPLYVGSKLMGSACLVGVIYDAHKNGVERSIVDDREDTAQRLYGQVDQYLTSNNNSTVISKLKKHWFNTQQAYPFHHYNSKTKGYLRGFGRTIFEKLPIVALSVVALLGKNADKSIIKDVGKRKGIPALALSVLSKAAGIILAGYAAKEVSNDVLCNGMEKKRL